MAKVPRRLSPHVIKAEDSKIRKDHVYGSHRSCFSDRKEYEGIPFTDRQKRIIAGTETDSKVTKRDIVVIMRKAESLERHDIAERVYDKYGYFFHENHEGDPSLEEAVLILRELTPSNLRTTK